MPDTGPAAPGGPPEDPEEWTDEQWLAWLVETDDEAPAAGAPTATMNRVSRSGAGQVLGNAMLGLARAIYGRDDSEVVVVAEGTGEPDEDDVPFTVHLDRDHPAQSYVVFPRPGEQPD